MVGRAASMVWMVALLASSALAQGASLEDCRLMRQQRDDLASKAMEQELVLVRAFRDRICPGLAQQAEGANARDQRFSVIDYDRWNACRVKAERRLETTHNVLYRNRQGFTYYTSAGAQLATLADQIAATMKVKSCQ